MARRRTLFDTAQLVWTQTGHVARRLVGAVREVKQEQRRLRAAAARGDDPATDPHKALEERTRAAVQTAMRCGNALEGVVAKCVADALHVARRQMCDPHGAIGIVAFAAVNEAVQQKADQDAVVEGVLAGVRAFASGGALPVAEAETLARASLVRGTRGYDTWAGM